MATNTPRGGGGRRYLADIMGVATHGQPVPASGENIMPPEGNNGGPPASGSKFLSPPTYGTKKDSPEVKAELQQKEADEIQAARNRRAEWEQTPEGQARTRDASSLLGTSMPVGMIYHVNGWSKALNGTNETSFYDQQLPGLSDPDAAARPARWEELDEVTQGHTHAALSKFGTSLDQIIADVGAQLDQSMVRANKHGEQEPYSASFYSPEGAPRQELERSARELGIPTPVHAVMNALTSPNTPFSHTNAATGETTYPNNESAMHSVRHVQGGGTWSNLTNLRTDRDDGSKHVGYTTNMQKAAKVFEQYRAGVSPAQWRGLPSKTNPEGKTIWGPKIGPYANAWSDSHPQFAVGDVHTGGGGAFAHLSSEKPLMYHEDGSPKLDKDGKHKRDKSEREKAIEKTPYFHSVLDFAFRRAMEQRGLTSVRRAQAAQWGEEKILREPSEEQTAYPSSRLLNRTTTPKNMNPDQGTLF